MKLLFLLLGLIFVNPFGINAASSSDNILLEEYNLYGLEGGEQDYYFNVTEDNHTLEINYAISSGYSNLIVTAANDTTNGAGLPTISSGQNGTITIPNVPAGAYKVVVVGTTNYSGLSFDIVDTGILTTQLNVPLLKQTDASWGSDVYGSGLINPKTGNPYTIGAKGCALTSLNMALDYVGAVAVDGNEYDPGTLNLFMQASTNDFVNSSVNWGPAVNGATAGQFQWFDVRFNSTTSPDATTDFLTTSIDAGRPVVVAVNPDPRGGFGHYVLVTGYFDGDFLINDPGNGKSLLSQYPSTFETRGVVIPTNQFKTSNSKLTGIRPEAYNVLTDSNALSPRAMYVAVLDNVQLQVYDSLGQLSGTDQNGNISESIPTSTVFTDALEDDLDGTPPINTVHYVYIKSPAPGEYTLQVTGVQTGSYTLSDYLLGSDGVATQLFYDGSATAGYFASYLIQTPPTVNVEAAVPSASIASRTKGIFTISRTGDTSSALTIVYSLQGNAVNGLQYKMLSGSVTIPGGSVSANIKIKPLNNGSTESYKVKLVIQPKSGYTVGSSPKAKISIFP